MPKKKFYITTPIYYVNDRAHLGHAYTTIAADVLARYHRLQGEEVFFLTGTDEHGGKIEKAAQKAGKSSQQLCDENSEKFRKTWENLNISYDGFIRTTDSNHIKAVQKVLQILYDKGFIYKGIYQGLYCLGCEQYKTKEDLVEGKCPDHQIKPELMEEESYLFKLSEFGDFLKEKIESDEFEIRPIERKNEVLGFLKQGLENISISRQKVKWGVPLPFDPKFTTYVWVDAFLNYLTGIGWDGNIGVFPKFWPVDLQLMAKDILRVHATIWPALLLSLKIPLPTKLFVHGYFTINGQKMSKSLGNIIWPEEMIEKFGIDAIRYLLLSACPFGRDGDISWQKLTEKYNADLASGIGNLLARTLTMAEKYWGGIIPKIDISKTGLNPFSPTHAQVDVLSMKRIRLSNFRDNIKQKYDFISFFLNKTFEFNAALVSINNLIKQSDGYIDIYKLYKPSEVLENNKEKIDIALYDVLETLRHIAWLLLPFLPETADKIFGQLGLDPKKEKEKTFDGAIKWGGLRSGTKIKKGEPLFPRI